MMAQISSRFVADLKPWLILLRNLEEHNNDFDGFSWCFSEDICAIS
jgi:hypothetical protein